MRILHPAQVGYRQPTNNINTINSTSTKPGEIITHLSSSTTTQNYSATNLSNLNGNTEEDRYSSYGLIDADDNVNLTLSANQNLSVRYTKHQNQIQNQNHNIAPSSRRESDAEILCNNLNQLNNIRSTTTTTDNTTAAKVNGNNNDIRPIFEGNLNVLEEVEENLSERPKKIPSGLRTENGGRNLNTKPFHNNSEEDLEEDEEEEEEGLEEEADGRNLICNEYHLSRAAASSNVSTTIIPNRNGNSVKVNNIAASHTNSSESFRQNLAKLDLDTNLQSSYQDHRHQQNFSDRQNQSGNTYKRARQNTSHTDRRCGSGRTTRYSSSYSCESSPDDSLMEDEDAYTPSPSSSTSMNSPEAATFTRGIINPNYPGFQHLAHTLSEHFVNHHSDADDSDLSEFEVELSVESLDENLEHFNANLNNNNLNNNNNNVISTRNSTAMPQNMSPNDELNYNLEAAIPKQAREHKIICLPEIRVSSSLDNNGDNTDSNSDKSDQETEDIVDGKPSSDPEATIVHEKDNPDSDHLDKCQQQPDKMDAIETEDISHDLKTFLEKYETVADVAIEEERECVLDETKQDDLRNCPTPDILIKNGSTKKGQKSSSENRPDLLRNVSPRPDSRNSDVQQDNQKLEEENVLEKKTRNPVPDNVPIEAKRPEKEDNSFGITPVDIVGDFGREVEREFGLIVSGYNTRILCREYSPVADSRGDNKLKLKTTDAALSNGKEHLSPSAVCSSSEISLLNASLVQPNHNITCDLLQSQQNAAGDSTDTAEQQSKHQATLLVHNNLGAASPPATTTTSSSNPKLMSKNSNASNQNGTSSSTEKLIPTAVVKPKYQKSSYDDRQLPPIGLGYYDRSRAWYDNKCSGGNHQHHNSAGSGASGNDHRSRKTQQFPSSSSSSHFDRASNSKVSKKLLARAGSSSLKNNKLPNSRRYEKDNEGSVVAVVTPRKKDKMEANYAEKLCNKFPEKNNNNNNNNNNTAFYGNNNNFSCVDVKRRETSGDVDKKEQSLSASFDVYNIETALPVIDLEAIENHLKKAKEEEKKRRNDREEIRRRLAMGAEDDYFSKIVTADRPGRKPSLQSRLQSGMNLQICFMNDASSDTESPSSDSETCPKLSKSTSNSSNMSRYSTLSSSGSAHPYNSRPLSISINSNNNRRSSNRPSTLSLGPPIADNSPESDFFTKQARLQIEARMALAQAKDMAHMQMEIERQKQKQSPITEVIRNSLEKVGIPFPPEKRRVSRQMLTDMNIAQLQIIVNELHTQIERLNEQLVQFLMERDELHMSQDSMLVDIEDLTRYLGAKEQSKVNDITTTDTINQQRDSNSYQQTSTLTNNTNSMTNNQQTQSKFQRIASLVKK